MIKKNTIKAKFMNYSIVLLLHFFNLGCSPENNSESFIDLNTIPDSLDKVSIQKFNMKVKYDPSYKYYNGDSVNIFFHGVLFKANIMFQQRYNEEIVRAILELDSMTQKKIVKCFDTFGYVLKSENTILYNLDYLGIRVIENNNYLYLYNYDKIDSSRATCNHK
jgi:hypothetical protein